MTPVEIIGLVSAVITFIDFAAENVAAMREISQLGVSATRDNAFLESRVKALDESLSKVQGETSKSPRNGPQIELQSLVDEYRVLTVKLLRLLGGLKSTKKRKVLWKHVKSLLNESEKERLVQDLNSCQSRIHLQLTQVTRHELGQRLEEIRDQGRVHMAELQQLRTTIRGLESDMTSWKHVPDLIGHVHLVIGQSTIVLDQKIQVRLLEQLKVDDMESRFEEIVEAHEGTFAWILSSKSTLEVETPDESTAKHQMMTWLSHGNGIFHITGKPGAGKSTLMKYLCQSPEAQTLLEVWAGDKSLLKTNFFFWRLGSEVQKSLDGLRRALLFSILRELPHLIQSVFPGQWKLSFERKLSTIQPKDVDEALEEVLRQKDFLSSHKLVFFIDGLDEFEGDHDGMMRLLLGWIQKYPTDVKFCVSSREWEIFTQRLDGYPKIKLQDITHRDIKKYVNQELSENTEFARYSLETPEILSLVGLVTTKAEGVFLWVRVTLQGLKWGLLCGDDLMSLEEKIHALPNELEALYQSIFDSIKNCGHTNRLDKMRAMRTLLAVLHCADADQRGPRGFYWPPLFELLLMFYSFFDEYERDTGFALRLPIEKMTKEIQEYRLEKGRRSVYQRCMGFLETTVVNVDDRPYDNTLRGDPDAWAPLSATEIEKKARRDDQMERLSTSPIVAGERSHTSAQYNIESNARDDFYHAHVKFKGDGKFNHHFPSRKVVRCIHRTAYEFLAQPRVEAQMRADSLDFNEADFHLQALLACLKTFRPSVHFVRNRLFFLLRRLLGVKLYLEASITNSRALEFLQEVARVLKHHDMTAGTVLSAIHQASVEPSYSRVEIVGSIDDALLLTMTLLEISEDAPLSAEAELAHQFHTKDGLFIYKDIVLDVYLFAISDVFLFPGYDRARQRFTDRVYAHLRRLFKSGLSANTRSQHACNSPVLTSWHAWLVHILACRDMDRMMQQFLELFLEHGADCNIWVKYGPGEFIIWWQGAAKAFQIVSGSHRIAEHRKVWFNSSSRVGNFLKFCDGKSGLSPLRDILPRMYPSSGSELQGLADRNQNWNPQPPADVWEVW